MADPAATEALTDERVELAIGGKLYSGWTSVSVSKAIEAVSGRFEVALTDRAREMDPDPFPIEAGMRCELRIAGETVINGWIDTVIAELDEETHSITVSGRDRTGDLADCSAIHKPGSWTNVKLETIAAALTQPFGIKVSAKADTGRAIARFAIQPGETVQAALERLLRFRGLLMVPTAGGDLELITPDKGAAAAVIEQGVNLKTIAATIDHADRFSEYLVKGQASGNDAHNGKAVSQIRASATDAGVTRHRPLLIVAEEQSDGASAATRAKWEAGVRAGKARRAEVEMIGWRPRPGAALWRVNLPVRLRAPAGQMADAAMLVCAVDLSRDDRGTLAKLTLMPPEAWQQLAEPEKGAGRSKRKSG